MARTPSTDLTSRRMRIHADDSSVVEQRTLHKGAEAVKRADTRWSQVRALPAAPINSGTTCLSFKGLQ
jgi:hypothetical protein